MMSRQFSLACLALAAACTTDKAAAGNAGKSANSVEAQAPGSTGIVSVKGGETFALRGGVSVFVERVTYINQPCPENVQCIHSGIIKTVMIKVIRSGNETSQTIATKSSQVVDGVEIKVLDVREGPVADIEASVPLLRTP